MYSLRIQLLASRSGKRIELRLTPGLALRSLRFDPALLLQAVQSRIERALLHLQHFAGDLLDALGDSPAVAALNGEGLKNQEIESSLYEIAWFTHTMIIYTSDCR